MRLARLLAIPLIAMFGLMLFANIGLCQSREPQALASGSGKAQTQTSSKVEGWASVPGGTVWLRPGVDAYEHDTGLVRDIRTGQRSRPITPQRSYPQPYPNALLQLPNVAPPPVYNWPRSPYADPYARNPQPYYLTPAPMNYGSAPVYDLGPGNVYAGQPCNGCGAKLGSPGVINQRWSPLR